MLDEDGWPDPRSSSGRGDRPTVRYGGLWHEIPIMGTGRLGLLAGCPARLYSTRDTRGKHLHQACNGRFRDECLNLRQFPRNLKSLTWPGATLLPDGEPVQPILASRLTA